jgi:hypothetical protein
LLRPRKRRYAAIDRGFLTVGMAAVRLGWLSVSAAADAFLSILGSGKS